MTDEVSKTKLWFLQLIIVQEQLMNPGKKKKKINIKEALWLSSQHAGLVIQMSRVQVSHTLTASWICSWYSSVQILDHAYYI